MSEEATAANVEPEWRGVVLAVDDDAQNLALVKGILAPLHVDIRCASSGEEAVRVFAAAGGAFDLVLLDVTMPGMDGFDTLAELRRLTKPGDRVPIVLVTGQAARQDRLRGLELGADDFLAKPLDINEVRCRARTFLKLREVQHALERRAAELERNVQEVVRANRLKSEFLANMSHELRTPLNAILGFTDLLLDGTFGPLNPKQQACASDVHSGGRHLLGLINDVLDLSKIEAGKMDLTLSDVDVCALASNVLTFVRPQATSKSIEISLVSEGELWARGDADRVRQILLNLLSNAVKFTPNGGRVTVEIAAGDRFVRTAIRDTGIGVAPGDVPRLFRDFSQVDGSITRKYGGSGLGLAISKRLVEMHGGRIGFEPNPGGGACFFFAVPLATRATTAAFAATRRLRPVGAASERELASGMPSVLIVDADARSGQLAAHALEAGGLGAVTAQTLAQAAEIAGRLPLVILVLDPVLASDSVDDALAFARERFGDAVLITSTVSAAELGSPRDYVAKPFDRAALLAAVRTLQRRMLRRTALVVDDSPAAADHVSDLLRQDGFEVEIVASLAAARKALARPRDLIVMEPLLPDGDGLELLAGRGADRATPTIILTRSELDRQRVEFLRGLAPVVLPKGKLSRSAFLRHVANACGASLRKLILNVDDNEQNLRLATAILTSRGYDVLEATEAASAIDLASAERPDVILMDVMLPDMDGLEATRRIRGNTLVRDIPVIAVTANAMPGDADRALAAGCCDYVTKPVDSKRLIGAIEHALENRAAPAH